VPGRKMHHLFSHGSSLWLLFFLGRSAGRRPHWAPWGHHPGGLGARRVSHHGRWPPTVVCNAACPPPPPAPSASPSAVSGACTRPRRRSRGARTSGSAQPAPPQAPYGRARDPNRPRPTHRYGRRGRPPSRQPTVLQNRPVVNVGNSLAEITLTFLCAVLFPLSRQWSGCV